MSRTDHGRKSGYNAIMSKFEKTCVLFVIIVQLLYILPKMIWVIEVIAHWK